MLIRGVVAVAVWVVGVGVASAQTLLGAPGFNGLLTPNLTGSVAGYGLAVEATALGSGTNGPATAQNAAFFSLTKTGFPSAGAVGEIDPVQIFGRQSGTGSDMSGLLINVQNTGLGFVSDIEMVSSIYNTGSSSITQMIDLQDGVLNALTGDYYGRVYTAQVGSLAAAIRVQNTSPATWGNILVNLKNNVVNLTITDTGLVEASGFDIVGGASGVSCTGTPTSSFASVNGIITHC